MNPATANPNPLNPGPKRKLRTLHPPAFVSEKPCSDPFRGGSFRSLRTGGLQECKICRILKQGMSRIAVKVSGSIVGWDHLTYGVNN